MSDGFANQKGGRWARLGKPNSDRRATGRLRQESLMCNLGPVIDLSLGGVRVLAYRIPKGHVVVDLVSCEDRLRLIGEVVWVKRAGILRRELGIRFVELDRDTAKILARMSMKNRVERVIHCSSWAA